MNNDFGIWVNLVTDNSVIVEFHGERREFSYRAFLAALGFQDAQAYSDVSKDQLQQQAQGETGA